MKSHRRMFYWHGIYFFYLNHVLPQFLGQVWCLVILPSDEEIIHPIGGNVVLTCETQPRDGNLQLSWFDPLSREITNSDRYGYLPNCLSLLQANRINLANSGGYGMWFVHPFCYVNSCPLSTTILMILITTYTAFRVMVQRTEMSATLIITYLESDDGGIYECRDTTNDGGESGTIRLILYGKISECAFIVNVIHVIWSDIRPCTAKPG